MGITVQELDIGGTRWIALRAYAGELVGWLKPEEAGDLGQLLAEKYGKATQERNDTMQKKSSALSAALIFTPLLATPAAVLLTPDSTPLQKPDPSALFAKVCFETTKYGTLCREIQLTPGETGPLSASRKDCEQGKDALMAKWFSLVGPVLGITQMKSEGNYEVKDVRCGAPKPQWESKARAVFENTPA